jgi:hypothetical protein
MSANNKLTLTNIDFDDLKNDLKSFLQAQSQFSDFDFEGSAINVLLDILAYNTHLNAFYLNMVANEMFLDTAVLRQSVVSHAKSLGYTAVSATASQATVNVSITKANTDPTTLLSLPRFTQFSSDALNGTSYNFVTLNAATSTASGNTFFFPNVLLKEGASTVKSFLYSIATNPTQIFDLTDANIDTSTIQVIVQKSITNILQTNFSLATDSTEVNANSNVFFLQEGTNGNYQIYFGDGIIGSALTDGNMVIISYIITNADAANSLQNFKLKTIPLSGATANIVTVNESAGGSPQESISSIKFNAPKAFVAQNRAVTKNDYIALINKLYPYFDAVTIWGGEELNPPVYGKVFISAKPKNGFVVTEEQQQFLITNIIKPISILTVTPEFVDADYNYIVLNIDAEFDSKQTTKNQSQIVSSITAAVNNYANINLNTFNSEFRLSRMLRAIDDSETSILSSTAEVFIEKQFTPVPNQTQTYTLTIGFPLNRGTTGNRLFSTPAFNINDLTGVSRQAFIEETPDSFSGLGEIDIITSGTGYISAPTLTIIGDGVGANAIATIVNGKVQAITIDQAGSEYTTATVTASGGGGSGATFRAVLQGKTGTLRTFYYDQSNNKIVLNSSAGTIDYINGVITITSFTPTSVTSPTGILKVLIQPQSLSFSSSQAEILTIDPNDQNAITVNLTDINNK